MPEKVVSGSPSRRSTTPDESGSAPRVASGSGALSVVSGPAGEDRVLSSELSVFPVDLSLFCSPEQAPASKRMVSNAATRAVAVPRWPESHTGPILSKVNTEFRVFRSLVQGEFNQLSRPQEHGVEHLGREDAGEGVLLGGVVAAEEDRGAGCYLGAVGELRLRPHPVHAEGRAPGKGAEADHDPGVEQLQLAGCVGEAGVALCGGGPVLRRGAAEQAHPRRARRLPPLRSPRAEVARRRGRDLPRRLCL